MNKKIIIIISSVFVLVALVFSGYYFLVTKNNSTNRTGDNNGNGFNGLFPFDNTSNKNKNASTSEGAPEKVVTGYLKKLRQMTTEPVAGAGFSISKAGLQSVRYIERATGHIYESELSGTNSSRLSGTTLPKAYDALWAKSSQSLLARYLDDDQITVNTYSLTLKASSSSKEVLASSTLSASSSEVSAIAFAKNIVDISVNNDSVFYLYKNKNKTLGIVSNFFDGNKKQIWTSWISEFTSQFVSADTIALNTKPEISVPGYLYLINTTSGLVTKVLSDINNLTSLVSPDGKKVLAASGASYSFYLYNISDKTTKILSPTTFPEKCVWSHKDSNIIYCAAPTDTLDGTSLISWYKGLVSFSDLIWKYDLKNGTSEIVDDLTKDSGQNIDAIKPLLSDDDRYLLFTNKMDNSLWRVDLTK